MLRRKWAAVQVGCCRWAAVQVSCCRWVVVQVGCGAGELRCR